jgi:hypothetical protein
VFSPTNVEDQTGEMSPAMGILVSPSTAAAQLPRGLFVIHGLFVFLGVNDCYRNFVLIQK